MYIDRPSTMTREFVGEELVCRLVLLTLKSAPVTCMTSRPGTRRRMVGMSVAPEWRMSSSVITYTLEGACEIGCSWRVAMLTVSSSLKFQLFASSCERGAARIGSRCFLRLAEGNQCTRAHECPEEGQPQSAPPCRTRLGAGQSMNACRWRQGEALSRPAEFYGA